MENLDGGVETAPVVIGGVAAVSETDIAQTLTDTTFGRAVDEFTGPSTGPIVEHVEDIEYAEPQGTPTIDSDTGMSADSDVVEEIPFVSPDVAPAQSSTAESAVEDEHVVLSSEDLVVPSEGMETAVEETTVEATAQGEEETAEVPRLRDISEIDHLEEFVAIPEDEPPVDLPSLADLEALEPAEQPATETPVIESPSVAPSPPAAPNPAPPTSGPREAGPVAPSPEPPNPANPPASASSNAPTIFGFEFEGGSFLGGMPLKLNDPPPTFGKVSYSFEAKRGNVAGLDAMVPQTPAAAPPIARAVTPPDEGSLLGAEPSPVASAAGASQAPPAPSPAAAPSSADKPATPSPAQPAFRTGRPVRQSPASKGGRGASPQNRIPARSLTDLSPDTVPPSNQQSTVPTIGDEMVVPPLAKATSSLPMSRKPLTTAFDGLATGAVRNTDVFSQMAPPINEEVFGAHRGHPDDLAIPGNEVQPVSKAAGPEAKLAEPGAHDPAHRGASAGADWRHLKAHGSRVPVLVGVMIFLLAAVWAGVYLYVPLYAKVVGTLSFSNLKDQSVDVQRVFETGQLSLLYDEGVRNVAKSELAIEHVPPGFLDDVMHFNQAFEENSRPDFKGETLEVVYHAPDAAHGRAQVNALLVALAASDAKLNDALARSQRDAADAKAAVDRASMTLEDVKKKRKEMQAAGDDRPDAVDVANAESDARRLAKENELAKAFRVQAEATVAALQSLDASKAVDPDSDPAMIELRRHLSELNKQTADFKASATTAPSASTAAAGATSGDAGASSTDPASTQPTDAASIAAGNDALIQQLQKEIEDTNTQINKRMATLQADQSLTPAQREVNRQKALEDANIRLTNLQKAEADAQTAAAAAAQRAKSLLDRREGARLAMVKMDQLIGEQTAAEEDLKAKADIQTEKERELTHCIAVSGEPQISVQTLPDQRPVYAGVGSAIILVIFCGLIISANRAAHTAAAAVPFARPMSGSAATPPPPSDPRRKRGSEEEEALTV